MPTFSLQRGPTALATWDLDAGTNTLHAHALQREGMLLVKETDRVGFVLDPADAASVYEIAIGDVPLVELVPNSDDGAGFALGGRLFWRDFPYFESARSQTQIVLRRRRDDAQAWETALQVDVYVLPSKLSEERYQKMTEELQALNRSLLLDLYGKSKRSYDVKFAREGRAYTSRRQELETIAAVLERLGGLLNAIRRRPASRIKTEQRRQKLWGGERIPPTAATWLARKGQDLRAGVWPVEVVSSCRVESFDLPEHRVLRAFLELLLRRATHCADGTEEHCQAIAANRKFRDVPLDHGPSLYEAVDLPQLKRLREASAQAEQAIVLARSMLALPFLQDVPAELVAVRGGAFQRSAEYRMLLRLIRRFLIANAVWYEGKEVEAVTKLTSRLFEQWCYLQIVEAFRACGLDLREWSDALRQNLHTRFILDFERGLMFEGTLNAELRLRFRYEPWILGQPSAAQAGETLCRGSTSDVAWSPDIVIECLRQEAGVWKPVYAIVLDCKYTSRIQDHHWHDTSKYLTIRRTDTMRQVVKQLWLIAPGAPGGIQCEDPAVQFGAEGPSCAAADAVRFLMITAPQIGTEQEEDALPSLFRRFAAGTLQFLAREFGV